jgi:hypothetical protein
MSVWQFSVYLCALEVGGVDGKGVLMKRVLAYGCVVVGLSTLACASIAFSADGPVAPAQKEVSQIPDEKVDGHSGSTVAFANASVSGGAKSGKKMLLAASDFTYLGSYPFPESIPGGATFGMGLTSRYVDEQLRFLTFGYSGSVPKPGAPAAQLIEFALPAKIGEPIAAATGRWKDIWSPASGPNSGGGDEYGLWWEDLGEGKGRLWTTHCTDYPNENGTKADPHKGINNPFAVAIRTLDADGKVSNMKGEYGFAGVGQRAIYGGVQPIPKWFRDKYGVKQPYAVGWGGYTSRMAQGLVPSLGLMMLAIPDVTTFKDGSIIPTKDFKILADHRSGTTAANDWYKSGAPTKFDRGHRNTDVVNYYDGGDKRQNPQTPPSDPPIKGAQWLSPAPDGKGRWVWGDTFYNTGCWIDGPNKGGFIAVGNFSKGKTFYMSSAGHNEGRHAELQIFDPDDFGKVLNGKLAAWKVQPVASKLLTADLTPLGLLWASSGNRSGGVVGATFDARTNRLYMWCPGVNGKYGCCLVVYEVKC